MARFLSMYFFHLKQYIRNSYFLWLVITSSLSLLLIKYMISYSQGQLLSFRDVLVVGAFGMWSSAITSAGILHFQRTQGVLVYLVNSPASKLVSLLALVSAPASFGLLSYPLAYVGAGLLNGLRLPGFKLIYLLYILLFWFSALVVTYLIAELFLLTKNAFVYESLFVTPLLIFSGLFSSNILKVDLIGWLRYLIPISYPVQLLTTSKTIHLFDLILWLLLISAWLIMTSLFFRSLLYKIRINGKIEAM